MEVTQRRLNDVETEAARLATTPRHVRTLRSKGLPFVRLGGKIRFDPDEVDRWLAQQRERREAS